MKLNYDELKQYLNDCCPKSNYLYKPIIHAHLIDQIGNEYYFFNFNDVSGYALIKYYHKYKHLFEFKEITLKELQTSGAEVYNYTAYTPILIENLMYHSLIF